MMAGGDAKKEPHRCDSFIFLRKPKSLFGSFNRGFSEVLHQLADVERVLASTGTGSFVAFGHLKIGVGLEERNLGIDFFNEFFHGF
jgi:hypothetical protein